MADAAAAAEGEVAEELACAICFETLAESTVLPCACKIDYCPRCWDRSLAQSFNMAWQARCPTCRAAVRVDVDVESGRLLFSREAPERAGMLNFDGLGPAAARDAPAAPAENEAEHGEAAEQAAIAREQALEERIRQLYTARNEVIERIARQAKPVQVRLLERYGGVNSALRDMARGPEASGSRGGGALRTLPIAELKRHLTALGGSTEGCLERADVLERLRDAAGGSWASVASYWASACSVGEAPRCVCGDCLLRVNGLDRAQRFAEHQHLQLQQLLQSGLSGIVCDLCDEQVAVSSAVWTCESGHNTIMHATAYDVCDSCFVRHAFGAGPAAAGEEEPGTDSVPRPASHAIL